MSDIDSTASNSSPPSPCINVCRMDPVSGLCEGCLRTLDEIAQWSTASESRKQAIWQQLQQRAEKRSVKMAPVPPADAGSLEARGRH
jgi:uncharacterized protein